jgi:hypothetical protein
MAYTEPRMHYKVLRSAYIEPRMENEEPSSIDKEACCEDMDLCLQRIDVETKPAPFCRLTEKPRNGSMASQAAMQSAFK